MQVAFFLKHWSEIKKSETMTQIWQQIRLGKHVGFEEGERLRGDDELIDSLAPHRGPAGFQAIVIVRWQVQEDRFPLDIGRVFTSINIRIS